MRPYHHNTSRGVERQCRRGEDGLEDGCVLTHQEKSRDCNGKDQSNSNQGPTDDGWASDCGTAPYVEAMLEKGMLIA